MLSIENIENKLKGSKEISSSEAFIILQSLCYLASIEPENNKIQQLLLRVLDRKNEFNGLLEVINGLVSHFGLYPYLDTNLITAKDAIAREMHRPLLLQDYEENSSTIENEGIVFHRVQAEVFKCLMNGENVILSAPTSFGKSALIDSLIESNKFQNIVIVVPTIALIDETRRRLAYLNCEHKIITHTSQSIRENNIFVLTQERAMDFPNLPDFDIFILDEFYKLDPKEDSERATTLNRAFYKLNKISKQFYLLGPNIENIPEGLPERFNCKFIKTDYSTVLTELIHLNRKNDYDNLVNLCVDMQDSTLIYCSSPRRARDITQYLVNNLNISEKLGLPEAAQWVAENYHPEWTFVKGLEKGIGMHHGSIPRALAQLCVKGFNDGKLPFLVCTSTLIEGVNTKAKNVIVFDNKIANKKYDFFTFSNIRGRSGRMFQHFVGNVYIFHEPPQKELPIVDIPLFSQNVANTKESLLIYLDKEDMTKDSWSRVEKYHMQNILSIDDIRTNSSIEPDVQLEIAYHMISNRGVVINLAWNGYPSYDKLEYLCNLIWEFCVKRNKYNISSGKQLAFKINQLHKKSIIEIIQNEIINNHQDPDIAVENTLSFIRNWAQFHFPRLAMAICRIQNSIAEQLEVRKADYSFFCGKVESLFLDPALIALDEYGLPLPLSQKIKSSLSTNELLDDALDSLSKLDIMRLSWLSTFEKEIINNVKKSL